MAGVHNGYLLEFPQIRVDCFSSRPRSKDHPWMLPSPTDPTWLTPARPAQLYLLTHVHTDHLTGLSDTFTGRIVCSLDTKRMLLRLEAEAERKAVHDGQKEVPKRKYGGLAAKVLDKGTKYERIVDNIEALPYNYPKEYEIGSDDNGEPITVTITLLDANHCPGSTMFLVTSADKAILHTGDVRADKLFIQSLRRNPAIAPFVAPLGPKPASAGGGKLSVLFGSHASDHQEDAILNLCQEMSMYPPDTIFFLNVWCFGWEDIVKEVARHFNTLVHVDRYKASIYSSLTSDRFLADCTTTDHRATRFHACERKHKCPSCRLFNDEGQRIYNLDKLVVTVNAVEVKSAQYALERETFLDALGKAALGEGNWPYNMLCPVARHAPLPELQNLVRLLRPRTLSPNTLVPHLGGMEYYMLPEYFEDCLQTGSPIRDEMTAFFERTFGSAHLQKLRGSPMAMAVPSDVSDRMEHVLDADMFQQLLTAMSGPIGAGRQATMMNHITRAMPASAHMVVADNQVERQIMQVTGQWQGAGHKLGGDESDDESQEKRRRRRYAPESASSYGSIKTEPDSKPSAVKSERKPMYGLSPKPEPDRKPIVRRFGLDKSHLQALSQVDTEQDT